MTTPFRWGILGTGTIARSFAKGLGAVDGAEIVAVGSRTLGSAEDFARVTGASRAHASYEALASDEEVDGIYIATPHTMHCENTLLCIEHGRAVLCEKPFAMNLVEAERMVAAARKRRVFLMEAMWTRFSPVMAEVRRLLREGAIGEPRMLLCDFGFRADFDPASRLFDPALGGGALLDVGVYCVSLARMVFGESPVETCGSAELGQSGVDEQSAWIFRYASGALAVMSSAVRTNTPHEAVICGSEGRIRIPDFWHPTRLFLGEKEQAFDIAGNGYGYEAAELARCVGEGLLESPLLPLDETLAIQADLDRIRGQWGLRYPADVVDPDTGSMP